MMHGNMKMHMKKRGTIAARRYMGIEMYQLSGTVCLRVEQRINDIRERLMVVRTILRLRKNL